MARLTGRQGDLRRLAVGLTAILLLTACDVSDVAVAPAAPADINSGTGGLGTVVAAVDVPVSFLIPGLKQGILVTGVVARLGTHVAAGDPLLTIDPTPLQSKLPILTINLQEAQAGQARVVSQLKDLNASSAVADARNQVLSAQQVLAADQHALAAAQQALASNTDPSKQNRLQAEVQAALQTVGHAESVVTLAEARVSSQTQDLTALLDTTNARVSLDQQLINIARGLTSTITAPIAGDIAAINVATGGTVALGRPLIDLIDASNIEVTPELPVTAAQQVQIGQDAELTFAELPSVTLHGTVLGISPSATENGQAVQVLVGAANTPDRKVLPGLQAYVSITTLEHAALTVPRSAIQDLDQNPTVFVVDQAGVAHLRSVRVGVSDSQHVQILSGLRVGDDVVVVGMQQLRDGSKVHVTRRTS